MSPENLEYFYRAEAEGRLSGIKKRFRLDEDCQAIAMKKYFDYIIDKFGLLSDIGGTQEHRAFGGLIRMSLKNTLE